ncbi:hypothetical protein APR09_004837 [Nocardia amikacinitolerans]|nr:hypothetical protein [Nocardia amikacinitolerans]
MSPRGKFVAGVSGAVIGKFAVAFGDRVFQQIRAIASRLGGFEFGECAFDSFGFFRPHVSCAMGG